MHKLFGWKDPDESGVHDIADNVGPLGKTWNHAVALQNESPQAFAMLSKCLEWDIKLYDLGRRLFEDQLAETLQRKEIK